MPDQRESEFVLAPNEYVYISDQTKGNVSVHVGPCKIQITGTDQPIFYDPVSQSYERGVSIAQAVQKFPFADERSYVVLENPSSIEEQPHPKIGTMNPVPGLNFGRCINIPGPCTFALWPGQIAKVVEGHQLRSNQYLVARIQNAEAAQKNWAAAIVSKVVEEPETPATETTATETTATETPATETPDKKKDKKAEKPKIGNKGPALITGQRLIIKGIDISFYIPPTGVEIIPDDHDQYVRNAVTLEHLQYCILLNENGKQRFLEGPDVIFPEPTESFLRRKNETGMKAFKFRVLELNDLMGLHVKRIDDDKGEELFITGKQQKIYVPRPEHSIIKHGDEIIHYAVAIPKGEARYTLNKETGAVTLKKGPCMFLPDPRKEQLIRRKLDQKIVELWFPGNKEAIEYNKELAENAAGLEDFLDYEKSSHTQTERLVRGSSSRAFYSTERESAEQLSFGDEIQRSKRRRETTLTLDTKYDGAVTINIWSGYAIQVISKTGDRKVIAGPKSVMLEYDEILEIINLSRGIPKTDKDKKRTVYLRVLNNKISDKVEAETKDLVNVTIQLSYRVNFEGDSKKWFNVEDYVGFLTDHLRSLIRNAVKQCGVEEFNGNSINILRNTILGEPEEGKRPGRHFVENDMRVYDVEVLDLTIGDNEIEDLLIENQHEAVQDTLEIRKKERELQNTKKIEEVNQKINKIQSETLIKKYGLDLEEQKERHCLNVSALKNDLSLQGDKDKIYALEFARTRDAVEQELMDDEKRITMTTEAFVTKFKAIEPDLIAALHTAGKMNLATEFVNKVPQSPAGLLNIFGGGGIEQLMKLVKGTVIEKGFMELLNAPLEEAEVKGNGSSD